jgi:hypothetical protein
VDHEAGCLSVQRAKEATVKLAPNQKTARSLAFPAFVDLADRLRPLSWARCRLCGLGDLLDRAGPEEGHLLAYAKKGYATLEATVERAGFNLD